MRNPSKTKRRFGTILRRRLPSGTVIFIARWSEGPSGPRRERSLPTRREAAALLAEVERQILVQQYVPPPTAADLVAAPAPERTGTTWRSFISYAKDLLERVIAPDREEATVVLYRANLKALRRYFGRRRTKSGVLPAAPLDGITPAAFLEYRAWRRTHPSRGAGDRKLTAATLNRDQAFAHLVLRHAVLEGLIDSNPLSGLKKLRERRRKRRWLSVEEVARLLKVCDDDFQPFVLAAVLTGARGCELRDLRWGDVHFDTGKIDIDRSKTGEPDCIDLHPNLARDLLRVKESRPEAREEDHVFLNRYGRPWKDMRRAWRRAVKGAGLEGRPGLTPHSLRHTHATFFLSGGGAVKDLQRQLGHRDLATTNRYADLVDMRRRKTIFSLPFGGQSGKKSCTQGGTEGGTTSGEGEIGESPDDYRVA